MLLATSALSVANFTDRWITYATETLQLEVANSHLLVCMRAITLPARKQGGMRTG